MVIFGALLVVLAATSFMQWAGAATTPRRLWSASLAATAVLALIFIVDDLWLPIVA